MRHSTSLHRALGHGAGAPAPRVRIRAGELTGTSSGGTPPPQPGPPTDPAGRRNPRRSRTLVGAVAAVATAGALAWSGLPLAALLVLLTAAVALALARVGRAPGRGRDAVGALDRAIAVLVALLLLPALVAIAAAVKVTSRGPAVVRLAHRGRDGEVVLRSRFRTGPGNGRHGPVAAGPGTTAFGEFLRRSGLDALPRLLDAARGEVPFLRPRRG